MKIRNAIRSDTHKVERKKQEFKVPQLTIFSSGKISDKNKLSFYREFSSLLKAGVDFAKALQILRDQEKNKTIKAIYSSITNDVVKGSSLFEAFKKHHTFSPYEYFSIKIGEEIRKLPEVLDRLFGYYEKKIKLKREVMSIITYPSFVILLTIGVLYFMLTYVVPMFAKVFKQFGGELPGITKFVIKLSGYFPLFITVFVIVILSLLVVHFLLKDRDRYKELVSGVLMRLPFIGGLVKNIYTLRFCSAMYLLLSSKTPLIVSLQLCEKMITFYPLQKLLQNAEKEILKGNTLTAALEQSSFLSIKVIGLLNIGEQVNQLDVMFDKISVQINEDISHKTKVLGTLLEPALIVVIGGLVGFIMVAMYTPIFNLSTIIGNN